MMLFPTLHFIVARMISIVITMPLPDINGRKLIYYQIWKNKKAVVPIEGMISH